MNDLHTAASLALQRTVPTAAESDVRAVTRELTASQFIPQNAFSDQATLQATAYRLQDSGAFESVGEAQEFLAVLQAVEQGEPVSATMAEYVRARGDMLRRIASLADLRQRAYAERRRIEELGRKLEKASKTLRDERTNLEVIEKALQSTLTGEHYIPGDCSGNFDRLVGVGRDIAAMKETIPIMRQAIVSLEREVQTLTDELAEAKRASEAV